MDCYNLFMFLTKYLLILINPILRKTFSTYEMIAIKFKYDILRILKRLSTNIAPYLRLYGFHLYTLSLLSKTNLNF